MKNKNIVLIALYNSDCFAVRLFHSSLKAKGFDVCSLFFKLRKDNGSFDMPDEQEITLLVEQIKKKKPFLTGISVNSSFFTLASEITVRLKAEIRTHVVWGGMHPTVCPQESIEYADSVCLGEGDQAIVELAQCLSEDQAIENIQNLWVKTSGKVNKNQLRPLIRDLDRLEIPVISDKQMLFIDKNKVIRDFLPDFQNGYNIITSRGCFYKCTYCSNSVWHRVYSQEKAPVRRRSPEHVIKELILAKQYMKNLKYIYFMDDVFSYDTKWLKTFLAEYKNRIGLEFSCYIQPDIIDQEKISMLAEAGLCLAIIGVQSGSKNIRENVYSRYISNRSIINASKLVEQYKIRRVYHVITNNPLEEHEDYAQTLDLFLALPRPFQVFNFNLSYFPGTVLTQRFLAEGKITPAQVVGIGISNYGGYKSMLNFSKQPEIVFWETLFYLAGKNIFPKKSLKWASKRKMLIKTARAFCFGLHFLSASKAAVGRSRLDWIRYRIFDFFAQQIRGGKSKKMLFDKLAQR